MDSWRRGRRRRRVHARHGGGVARRAGVVGSGTHRADRHRSARSGTDATTGTRDRAAARRARSRRLRRPDQHGQGRRDRGARRDRGRRAGTAYPANAENSCRGRRASAAGGWTGDPANPDRLRATCGNGGPEPGRWNSAGRRRDHTTAGQTPGEMPVQRRRTGRTATTARQGNSGVERDKGREGLRDARSRRSRQGDEDEIMRQTAPPAAGQAAAGSGEPKTVRRYGRLREALRPPRGRGSTRRRAPGPEAPVRIPGPDELRGTSRSRR